MSLFDFLVNKKPLRRQRDTAKEFASEAYNPNVYNELVNFGREQATEGISENVENITRTNTLRALFAPQDYGLYGGNQAAAIAGSQAQTQGAQSAMAQMEAQLGLADEASMQQGRQQYAQARTQQEQVSAQKRAAFKEADLQYEAEVERRGQAIGGTVLGVAGSLLTTPFGGAVGSSLVERGLSGIFGGGENNAEGAIGTQLGEIARSTVGNAQPQDVILEDPVNLGMLANMIPTDRIDNSTMQGAPNISDLMGLFDNAPEDFDLDGVLSSMFPTQELDYLEPTTGGDGELTLEGFKNMKQNQQLQALVNTMGKMNEGVDSFGFQENNPYTREGGLRDNMSTNFNSFLDWISGRTKQKNQYNQYLQNQ